MVEYAHEAAKIGLNKKPSQVPKNVQPLVIATIYIEGEATMLVDVRSIERAVKLTDFIDKYVPRGIAEITHAAIYNQLVTVSKDGGSKEISDIDFDEIFKQKNIYFLDIEKNYLNIKKSQKNTQTKRKPWLS